MSWVRPFDIITRPAVVPNQPARLGGHAPGRAHQHRAVRPEQEITSPGDFRQDSFERAPVAAVILGQQLRPAVQRVPGFESPQGLLAELREPPRQREAGPDAQPDGQGTSPHVDLVPEPMPVCGDDRILHLNGPVLRIVDRPQDAEHRYALGQSQPSRFIRRRHAARDIVNRARDLAPDRPVLILDERVGTALDVRRLLERRAPAMSAG